MKRERERERERVYEMLAMCCLVDQNILTKNVMYTWICYLYVQLFIRYYTVLRILSMLPSLIYNQQPRKHYEMHKKERDRENLRVRERNEPNAQSAK